jgi:hypothetical protein
VTLTISEGAKTTYAEIIATARRSIPLTEIGVKSIRMRKADGRNNNQGAKGRE